MKIQELYYAAIQERISAKREGNQRDVSGAEALIAYIDELVKREFCTMEDETDVLDALRRKLDANIEASKRTDQALLQRMVFNRENMWKGR